MVRTWQRGGVAGAGSEIPAPDLGGGYGHVCLRNSSVSYMSALRDFLN